jgi:phage recombination protein Bet
MSAITKTAHFSPEQISLLKSHLMASGKDAPPPSDADLQLYGMVCQRLELDPFSKQIYAIQRKGKWTFQISIDGLRAIADRTGQYAGSDEPLFDEGLTQFEAEQKGRAVPSVCKVTVYKIVQGHKCSFVGIAKYSEFAQSFYDAKSGQQKAGEMWGKMPYTMLSKCAESQALRKAFPQVVQVERDANAQVIDTETIAEDWRTAAANWALSQGLDPETAYDVAEVSTSKQNFMDRVKPLIEKVKVIAEIPKPAN